MNDGGPPIFIVIAGGIVLGAYVRADSAYLHARCVTGAVVVDCELLDGVPDSVRDDIASDFEDDIDADTPVVDTTPTLDERRRRR